MKMKSKKRKHSEMREKHNPSRCYDAVQGTSDCHASTKEFLLWICSYTSEKKGGKDNGAWNKEGGIKVDQRMDRPFSNGGIHKETQGDQTYPWRACCFLFWGWH